MVDKKTEVLLADAHTCSRVGLYQVLADACFSIAAETGCLDDLEALLSRHQPHVLLLAGNLLPDRPRRFLIDLRQRYPDLPIVLYLSHFSGDNAQVIVTHQPRPFSPKVPRQIFAAKQKLETNAMRASGKISFS